FLPPKALGLCSSTHAIADGFRQLIGKSRPVMRPEQVSHRQWIGSALPIRAVIFLKKRLFHSLVNDRQPLLRLNRSLMKVIGLALKLACPFLSSPQLHSEFVC